MRVRYWAIAIAAGLVAAPFFLLSPLQVFGLLFDHSRNVGKWASGIPYGDHPRQRLDVHAPLHHKNLTDRRPVVILLHGGSWRSGSREDYRFVGRAIAEAGFLAVVPGYRLYPEAGFPDFVHDNARAIRWVQDNISHLGGNARRMAVVGVSAGAYNAMLLALDERYFDEHGVDSAGIQAFAGLAGPYGMRPADIHPSSGAGAARAGASPLSPLQLIDRSRSDAAFMVATGASDRIVDPQHSTLFHDALKSAGREVKFHRYEGLGHIELLLSLASTAVYKRAEPDKDLIGFLRETLEPRVQLSADDGAITKP